MAAEDAALKELLTHNITMTLLASLVLYFAYTRYEHAIYAMMMSLLAKRLSKSKKICKLKQTIFSAIQPNSKIVEIGAGSGANFEFYPNNCSVVCVEPKVVFESYVTDSVKKNGQHLSSIEFVEGVGERLSDVIEPNSCDYVVCTLVLCSVENIGQVAKEITRVLKPGGKFLFMEHVFAPHEYKFTRLCQRLITNFSKIVADNCHFNREPWTEIEKAGFSQVDYERKLNDRVYLISPVRWICSGAATKLIDNI